MQYVCIVQSDSLISRAGPVHRLSATSRRTEVPEGMTSWGSAYNCTAVLASRQAISSLMSSSHSIPPPLLAALHRVEPNAQFFQSPASTCQVQSSATNRTYFAKLGSATGSDAEQYEGEAQSLRAMYAASPGICPRVFECHVDAASGRPVFVSEHKNIGPLNEQSARALASALAEMHTKGKSPTGQYGFAVPTYCGRTRMSNVWSQTWRESFDRMIGDLLDTLRLSGNFDEICALGEKVRERWVKHGFFFSSCCHDLT